MKREQLIYLLVGLAFGLLVGYGAYAAWGKSGAEKIAGGPGAVPSPAGPMAPTQTGPTAGGSPFMQEFERIRTRLDQNPEDVAALVEMGDLAQSAGMWEQAVQVYERAITLRPDDPDLLTVAGRCYAQLGDGERALERLLEARRIDPDHAASLYNIAMVEGLVLGRIDDAEESLRKLETEHPEVAGIDELRDALAAARQEAGQPDS
ncbi:MAG: tetratricopeptide repeat protein [Acidobacteriota bacterium]|nr:tetratricopeptide repeat protein [Acidobacteriota bacterium]